MKRISKVIIIQRRPLDKLDVLRYITLREGNITIEELNQRFHEVYDEEIGEAVIEYLAARRMQW